MDSPFHLPDTNDTGEMKRIFGALSNLPKWQHFVFISNKVLF